MPALLIPRRLNISKSCGWKEYRSVDAGAVLDFVRWSQANRSMTHLIIHFWANSPCVPV